VADPRQPLSDWLEQKKYPLGDHCLNEHAHLDRDPRGDHGEWGRCITPSSLFGQGPRDRVGSFHRSTTL